MTDAREGLIMEEHQKPEMPALGNVLKKSRASETLITVEEIPAEESLPGCLLRKT